MFNASQLQKPNLMWFSRDGCGHTWQRLSGIYVKRCSVSAFPQTTTPPPLTFIVIVVHRRRTWNERKENTPNLYNFPILSFQNILDKFNPGARQLISAGKAYLKALHGKKMLTVVFIYLTTYTYLPASPSYPCCFLVLLSTAEMGYVARRTDEEHLPKINQLISLSLPQILKSQLL